MTARLITVDDRLVRVDEAGDSANPPVLLVHGIGRSLEDWDELSERLSDSYRVIRFDVPGFGYSDPRRGAIDQPSLSRGLGSFLDSIGETRPIHMIGNSLGGAITMEFAATHPDRVRSMTLVDSAGFGASVTFLLRLLTVPILGWLATRRTTKRAARMFENAIFADRSVVTKERVARAVVIGNQPGNGNFMLRLACALGTWRGVRSEWRASLLSRVTKQERPTLIIWGDRDRILPVAHMDQALKTFPRASSHLFRGVGHMPQIENPDECARVIRDFLATA